VRFFLSRNPNDINGGVTILNPTQAGIVLNNDIAIADGK
jgi:hypothetical protein